MKEKLADLLDRKTLATVGLIALLSGGGGYLSGSKPWDTSTAQAQPQVAYMTADQGRELADAVNALAREVSELKGVISALRERRK